MGVTDLFSKRQKRIRGEVSDVYCYDSIPQALRVQIIYILRQALGNEIEYFRREQVQEVYNYVVNTLRREYGFFKLIEPDYFPDRNFTLIDELFKFILKENDAEKVLDAVELSFWCVDDYCRNFEYRLIQNFDQVATDAINELNYRFQEHGVGYQYQNGQIIRVDSTFLHKEAVIPTLSLLNDSNYQGVEEEFLKAHEHYRHGKYKEALNECLKSFESMMKAICEKRKWDYNYNDTAKNLIKICLQNDLIPSFSQNYMNQLQGLLESGIPTARNKLAGHGQGSTPKPVEEYLVAYVLHMTASTILFLSESEKNLP